MEGVVEGRIVHYIMAQGLERPAIIVRAWGDGGGPNGCVNLQVFIDGTNDTPPTPGQAFPLPETEDAKRGVMWRKSVVFSQNVKDSNTWHWPEKGVAG